MLEVYAVFGFENILVSRMISAIAFDCHFIATSKLLSWWGFRMTNIQSLKTTKAGAFLT